MFFRYKMYRYIIYGTGHVLLCVSTTDWTKSSRTPRTQQEKGKAMSHTSHEHIDRCLFFIRMYFYWLIYSLETLRLSIAMSSISRVVFIAVRRVQQIIRCSNLFNLYLKLNCTYIVTALSFHQCIRLSYEYDESDRHISRNVWCRCYLLLIV